MTKTLPLLAAVLLSLPSSPAIAQSGWLQDALKRTEARKSQNTRKITNQTSFNKRATKKLNQAIKKSNVEAVKSAILAGANVNDKNKGGWTPLHLAAKRGHTEIIKVLIGAGADLSMNNQLGNNFCCDIRDTEGATPIDLADRYGHGETRKLLITETASFLINTGTDLNSKGVDGWTLLHWAVRHGYVAVVRNLIDSGADVNNENDKIISITEEDSYTVYNESGYRSRETISKTEYYTIKETPLYLASQNDTPEGKKIVQLLLDAGADNNAIEDFRNDEKKVQAIRQKLKEDLQREILERERFELDRERLKLDRERLEFDRERQKLEGEA